MKHKEFVGGVIFSFLIFGFIGVMYGQMQWHPTLKLTSAEVQIRLEQRLGRFNIILLDEDRFILTRVGANYTLDRFQDCETYARKVAESQEVTMLGMRKAILSKDAEIKALKDKLKALEVKIKDKNYE